MEWYGGPATNKKEGQCGATYMGIVPRYQNIQEDSCGNKKCTACEIRNSFSATSSVEVWAYIQHTYFLSQLL